MRLLAPLVLALSFGLPLVACDEKPSERAPVEVPRKTVDKPNSPAPAEKNGALNSRGMSPKEVELSCQHVCEKTSKLPCVKIPECVAGCLESFQLPACRSELGAMLRCTEGASPDAFACDDSPTPVLKDGACEAEQEEAARCIEQLISSGRAAE